MSNPIIGPVNTVFSRAVILLTKQGGTEDDIPIGEVQNFTLTCSHDLVELMGPSQLVPIGVGLAKITCTGSGESPILRAGMLAQLLGAEVPTFAAGKTTVSLGVNSSPTPFKLHLLSPTNGSDLEIILFGCVCPSWDLTLGMHQWGMQKFSVNIYGDGTNIAQILLPGDQTAN